MPIMMKTPITPVEPDKKYDRRAVTMTVTPIPEPGGLTGSASLMLTPYRVLSDDTTEMRPDLAWTKHIPDVNAEAARNPKFRDLITRYFAIVEEFADLVGAP